MPPKKISSPTAASKTAASSVLNQNENRDDPDVEDVPALSLDQIRERLEAKRLLLELRRVELEEAEVSQQIRTVSASKFSGTRFSTENSVSSRTTPVNDLSRILKTLKCLDIPVFSGVGSKVLKDYDFWTECIKKSVNLVPSFSVFFPEEGADAEEEEEIDPELDTIFYGFLTFYLKDVALKHIKPFAGHGFQALKELELLLRPKELSARTGSMLSLLEFTISPTANMIESLQSFDRMYSAFEKETGIAVNEDFKVCHLLTLVPSTQYMFVKNVFINSFESFQKVPYLKFQSELRAVYSSSRTHSKTPSSEISGVEYKEPQPRKSGSGKPQPKNRPNPLKQQQQRDEREAMSKDSKCACCGRTGHTTQQCFYAPGNEARRDAYLRTHKRHWRKSSSPPKQRRPQQVAATTEHAPATEHGTAVASTSAPPPASSTSTGFRFYSAKMVGKPSPTSPDLSCTPSLVSPVSLHNKIDPCSALQVSNISECALDTGACRHFFGCKEHFTHIDHTKREQFAMASSDIVLSDGTGTVVLQLGQHTLTLPNVAYYSKATSNLVSVSCLEDDNGLFLQSKERELQSRDNTVSVPFARILSKFVLCVSPSQVSGGVPVAPAQDISLSGGAMAVKKKKATASPAAPTTSPAAHVPLAASPAAALPDSGGASSAPFPTTSPDSSPSEIQVSPYSQFDINIFNEIQDSLGMFTHELFASSNSNSVQFFWPSLRVAQSHSWKGKSFWANCFGQDKDIPHILSKCVRD